MQVVHVCVLFIVKSKLRLKHRWEIPTQIPAVSAADGCDHVRIFLLNIFLYYFPLIVNILLAIWKCVGSVLPRSSPFDTLFLFSLPPSENRVECDPF